MPADGNVYSIEGKGNMSKENNSSNIWWGIFLLFLFGVIALAVLDGTQRYAIDKQHHTSLTSEERAEIRQAEINKKEREFVEQEELRKQGEESFKKLIKIMFSPQGIFLIFLGLAMGFMISTIGRGFY